MATGTRLMQEISDQFLNCKICFENLREPKTLSCLHTFCCSCLQLQYEQELTSRTSRFAIYSRQVSCPLCRKRTDLPMGGVKRLPDNFLVSNLTQVLAKRTVSKVAPCEICCTVRARQVDGCSKCLDCNKILCRTCVDLHLSTKVTQQHSLIDLEGEKDIQCKSHPEESVRFYCEPCQVCICVVCAFQEHREHEVCSLSQGSSKCRVSLEQLLTRCQQRLTELGSRLMAMERYESTVKGLRENIRDMAISYIAQVRAKEKELMKQIEEEYGGEIQEFLGHRQSLQENLDELQGTCNLTDIMLRDKGVELLLIKKEMEGKMNQLLLPVLPEVPANPKYDVSFVPGPVALGGLFFGSSDVAKSLELGRDKITTANVLTMEQQLAVCRLSQSIEPDVVPDIGQFDKSKLKDIALSCPSDIQSEVAFTSSQLDMSSSTSRDWTRSQSKIRERGIYVKDSDTKMRISMTTASGNRAPTADTQEPQFLRHQNDRTLRNSNEYDLVKACADSKATASTLSNYDDCKVREDKLGANKVINKEADRNQVAATLPEGNCRLAPDLLPRSAEVISALASIRKIRSIKIQTEISCQEIDAASLLSDSDFVKSIIEKQILMEREKQNEVNNSPRWRRGERSRRFHSREEHNPMTASIDNVSGSRQEVIVETSSRRLARDRTNLDQNGEYVDSSRLDTRVGVPSLASKSTSTKSVFLVDQETFTPQLTSESKSVWTDPPPTSDRATSTVIPSTVDRSTGTAPLKTGEIGLQTKPHSSTVCTNTLYIATHDHDAQTSVDTSDQATVPDKDLELYYAKKNQEAARKFESSVDCIPAHQPATKPSIQVVDRATDPIKISCSVKATETLQIKTVTSSTETEKVKVVDRDAATMETKTTDQWTETIRPQLMNTGVSPPIPATLDVGVATTVVLTDEQATCTDLRAYRDAHTETVLVVCDNETLTDVVKLVDAQTFVQVLTDDHQCATELLDNTDEGSMTDRQIDSWDPGFLEACLRQQRQRLLNTPISNGINKGNLETQINFDFGPCGLCGRTDGPLLLPPEASALNQVFNTLKTLPGGGKEPRLSSTSSETQDVATMAISCLSCLHQLQEAAIQTTPLKVCDQSSDASLELNPHFLASAPSKDYQDAATSTDSLPPTGLLGDIKVDPLTPDSLNLIMVDDETSTDFLKSLDASTQTWLEEPASGQLLGNISPSSMDSFDSRGVGEIIRSLIESTSLTEVALFNNSLPKSLISIGVNTIPKVTLDQETTTTRRNLFSTGTMTCFVSRQDKSTSTMHQARVIASSNLVKCRSEDKITMTCTAEKRDASVETDPAAIDGRITKCISKLRSISEKLNSPPAKKSFDTFFGTNFSTMESVDINEDSLSRTSSADKLEEERQRQIQTLLEQTNALLKSKDRSPVRKPQPITTLKGRIQLDPSLLAGSASPGRNPNLLSPTERAYESRSLPRVLAPDRPGHVRMGSQPLSPTRLPLLRYNSAPGRIATVPTQTLLKMCSGQSSPTLGVCLPSSPRVSPSRIPISKKQSPPEQANTQPQYSASLPLPPTLSQTAPTNQSILPAKSEIPSQDGPSVLPALRRPLPSITETRTPSSCSDSSTASFLSAESSASVEQTSDKLPGQLPPTDSTAEATSPSTSTKACVSTSDNTKTSEIVSSFAESTVSQASNAQRDTPNVQWSNMNRLSADLSSTSTATSPLPRSPSTNTTLSTASTSLSDSVFRQSYSEISQSAGSTETLDDKCSEDKSGSSTPSKKSGMGFMQRLLSRKKKAPEAKKEPISVVKAGPSTCKAVAALATAGPPVAAPTPESQALAPLHFPPHHYPPLPEHHSPPLPRKPRPCVYVNQRLVTIQQDNVEEMTERKAKQEHVQKNVERTDGGSPKIEKLPDKGKSKDKSKKDMQVEKKKKKEEKESKHKLKESKLKTKLAESKPGPSPQPIKKLGVQTEDDQKQGTLTGDKK